MLTEPPCNLCASTRSRVVYETALPEVRDPAGLAAALRCTNAQYRCFGRIVRCLDCGLMFRSPQEDDTEAGYAEVVDEEYLANEASRRATYEKSLRLMRSGGDEGGRLLDVGCYVGTFLDVARSCGWDVQGLEPSRWAAEVARGRYGLDVVTGSISEAELAPGSFDVVTLWDALEHLRDPRGSLERVREWLVPDGRLWLSTMNVEAAFPRLMGRRWPHYMRMHLWYFSRPTLRRLLEAAGFELMGIWPHVRVLQLGYLTGRLQCYGDWLAASTGAVVRALRLGDAMLPVSARDLVTIQARKLE